MSSPERPDDDDKAIWDRLAALSNEPSDAHNERVQSAAEEAGAQIRARISNRRRAPSRRPWLALAASVAILAVGLFVLKPSFDRTDAVRSAGPAGLLPADRSSVAQFPASFQWPAQPAATTYRLVLRDATGTVIWNSPAGAETRAAVPEDVRARAQPAADYVWTVEVTGTDGSAELGPYWFRIEPK
jgi:hypothetical protein